MNSYPYKGFASMLWILTYPVLLRQEQTLMQETSSSLTLATKLVCVNQCLTVLDMLT